MEPLVLIVSENVLAMSRIVNNLRQMKYRTEDVRDPRFMLSSIQEHHPMFVILDLRNHTAGAMAALKAMKQDPALQPILVMAFGDHTNEALLEEARQAGAEMVTTSNAVISYLPQLVDQLLGL